MSEKAEQPQCFLNEARVKALVDPCEQLTEAEQQMFLDLLETRLSMPAPHELRAGDIFIEGLQFCLRRNPGVMKELALMEATGGIVDLICSDRYDYDFADLSPILSPVREVQEMQRTAPHQYYLRDFARRWEDKDSELHKWGGKVLPKVGIEDVGVACYYEKVWRLSVPLSKIAPYDERYPLYGKKCEAYQMQILRRAVLEETDVIIEGVKQKLRDVAIVRVEGGTVTVEPYGFTQGTTNEVLKIARLEERASEIGCSLNVLLSKKI